MVYRVNVSESSGAGSHGLSSITGRFVVVACCIVDVWFSRPRNNAEYIYMHVEASEVCLINEHFCMIAPEV